MALLDLQGLELASEDQGLGHSSHCGDAPSEVSLLGC